MTFIGLCSQIKIGFYSKASDPFQYKLKKGLQRMVSLMNTSLIMSAGVNSM